MTTAVFAWFRFQRAFFLCVGSVKLHSPTYPCEPISHRRFRPDYGTADCPLDWCRCCKVCLNVTFSLQRQFHCRQSSAELSAQTLIISALSALLQRLTDRSCLIQIFKLPQSVSFSLRDFSTRFLWRRGATAMRCDEISYWHLSIVLRLR